jgi:hypothetical protein
MAAAPPGERESVTPVADDTTRAASPSSGLDAPEDPRLTKAVNTVRRLSSAHLKEQCVRTEWAALETEAERDLLVETVADAGFWSEVKQMTLADVETLPDENGENEVDTEARLLQMFKCFDKDNSGSIDANELHQMFLYMGITTTETEVKDIINQVDKNGDGSIDEQEFLMVMKKAQGGAMGSDNQNAASSPGNARRASFRAQRNTSEQDEIRASETQ